MRFRGIAVATMSVAAYALSYAAVDTRQAIFDSAFNSLRVTRADNLLSSPLIILNSSDQVSISFDEFAEERSYLRYSILHCNADWQPSDLVESDYLEGFNVADITDYALSSATTTHYVNYNLTIPNESIAPKLSGNYLVRIYREDTPDDIVIQARFMVSENSAGVDTEITSRTDIDYNQSHQQLSVIVDTNQAGMQDPFNELYIVVSQNGREDNKVAISHPLKVVGERAYYEHLRALIFPAGNEYRRMETVSVHYPAMHIASISYAHPYYHMTLEPDEARNESQYLYDQTQHGRFFIREYNSSNSDTEADYVITHFTLNYPEITDADIFLDGEFTNRHFGPESRMVYNRAEHAYTSTQLLKQGAYNYQYLIVPHGATIGYTEPLEGDFYQTINEYMILVYYRKPLSRYDRLIGSATILSGR